MYDKKAAKAKITAKMAAQMICKSHCTNVALDKKLRRSPIPECIPLQWCVHHAQNMKKNRE
jgi:hypothetical protein